MTIPEINMLSLAWLHIHCETPRPADEYHDVAEQHSD